MKNALPRLFSALSLAFFGIVMILLGYEPANWAMWIVGAFLIATSVFVFSFFPRIALLAARVRSPEATPSWLKYVWRSVNSALILSVGWAGYLAMAPERVADSIPDLPWPSYFFVPPIIAVVIIVMLHVDTRKTIRFQRPSLDRPPFKWLSDSLQPLFIATLAWIAAALGATIRLPHSGQVGFRVVVLAWCIPAGFIIGEVVGYAIYRRKITVI